MSHENRIPVKSTPKAVLSSDTSIDAERMQISLWQGMSPLDKARTVGRVSRSVRELSMAGIRQRYPAASEHECRLHYAMLTLGRHLACKAYPEANGLFGR